MSNMRDMLIEMQKQSCTFIITIGVYDDYRIKGAFQGWTQAVDFFSKLDSGAEEKRLEVWKHDKNLGEFIEVVAKKNWNVSGVLESEKGLAFISSNSEFKFED